MIFFTKIREFFSSVSQIAKEQRRKTREELINQMESQLEILKTKELTSIDLEDLEEAADLINLLFIDLA